MGFAVSPEEAQKKLVEVVDSKNDAVKALTQLKDATQQVTSGSWTGSASSAHLEATNVNDEEFQQVINLLNRTVETASEGIKKAVTQDHA